MFTELREVNVRPHLNQLDCYLKSLKQAQSQQNLIKFKIFYVHLIVRLKTMNKRLKSSSIYIVIKSSLTMT